MALIQLSREDSFEKFVFGKLKALDSIILCEGATEKLVTKKLVVKLRIDVHRDVGILECGGIPHIYNYASIVSLLVSIAYKVRSIGVIVDGEDMKPQQRAESLVNSIRARGIEVHGLREVKQQLFKSKAVTPNKRSIDLLIAVNGVYSYNLVRHTIHDHGLMLAYRMNRISNNTLQTARLAEDIIDTNKLLELIDQANANDLKECFNHIIHLVKTLSL